MRSKSKREKRRNKKLILDIQHLNIGIFSCILIIFFIASIILPKENISEIEKRKLASFPSFSIQSFFSGEYFKGIDAFYNDTFPLRNKLLEIASSLDEAKGIRKGDDEIKIYMVEN